MTLQKTVATYTTKEIAELIGIHPNTVRFYEEIGFLTPPKRRENGYRVYTSLQLEQCRIIRLAMRAEVLQNGLRNKAVEIVRLCAALDFERALAAAEEYRTMLEGEIDSARAAIACVESIMDEKTPKDAAPVNRREAAERLGVTTDTLRNWELNGLIKVKRLENGYRIYSPTDMERLNIIRALRCANYSLSSILRLLNQMDSHSTRSVEAILNTPETDEDIVSVCDRLILSLESTVTDAKLIAEMVKELKGNFRTIQ